MKKEDKGLLLALTFFVLTIATIIVVDLSIIDRPHVKFDMVKIDIDKELIIVNTRQRYKDRIVGGDCFTIPIRSLDSLKQAEWAELELKVELFKEARRNCK